MKSTLTLAAAAAAVGLFAAGPVLAADHQVKELNQGSMGMMAFEPGVLKIKLGDTVSFVPTDYGHGVQSIDGMLPAGATPVSIPGGKPGTVKFTKPGVYGLKCAPHFGMGMVMLIEVGAPANLAQAQAAAATTPPLARKRLATEFAMLK